MLEAVAAGATYEQAAKQAGYATRSGAYKAFWQAMDSREADGVDMHRELELQRLNAMQLALWDKAMDGDVKAVLAVARIIEQRIRLLGLDRHTGATAQTVVMSPAGLAAWKETQGADA